VTVIYFCRRCWREVDQHAVTCACCGALQAERLSYREELELALACPEALTARRAAYLLGLVADARSVPALGRAVSGSDPYVAEEAVRALAKLDSEEARKIVRAAADHPFVTVRAAARELARR
jgi:HEAT repeat protein